MSLICELSPDNSASPIPRLRAESRGVAKAGLGWKLLAEQGEYKENELVLDEDGLGKAKLGLLTERGEPPELRRGTGPLVFRIGIGIGNVPPNLFI